MVDLDELDFDAIKRYENMAELYLNGNKFIRETILSFLSEEEKMVFLEGVGFYHLFTDERFYKNVVSAIGKQIYNELHTAF